MSRPNPTRIDLQFDDGSRRSFPFDHLPGTLQQEILRQPFAAVPCSDPDEARFVLFQWDDGWIEVIQVDRPCTDINRYYVINRPEDVGRLSLNRGEGSPELIEIFRKPKDLKKITFLDTYDLTLESSTREGKKWEHFFACEKGEDFLSEMNNRFKRALDEEGVSLEDLQTEAVDQLREFYERIRKRMDIKASRRQQDVYDFIALMCKVNQ
jgi:hypothetical protein